MKHHQRYQALFHKTRAHSQCMREKRPSARGGLGEQACLGIVDVLLNEAVDLGYHLAKVACTHKRMISDPNKRRETGSALRVMDGSELLYQGGH
jgi:hypothetical protein